MTSRQIFDALLVECNKVNAPSLLLEDFNYLFNKAINQYVNKQYNIYDVNQQTTDNLRVLKSSVKLKPNNSLLRSGSRNNIDDLYNGTYEVELPDDYLHTLNCICCFNVKHKYKCYNPDTHFYIGAKRLTSDAWSTIITDYYNRPSYKNPYYYINNINTSDTEPYNLYDSKTKRGTDQLDIPYVNQYKLICYTDDDNTEVVGTVSDLGLTINNGKLYFNLKDSLKDTLQGTNQRIQIKQYYSDIFTNDNLKKGFDIEDSKNTRVKSFNVKINNECIQFVVNGNQVSIETNSESDNFDGNQCLINLLFYDNAITFPKTITLSNNLNYDIQDKYAYNRHSNQSKVVCEIRCGKDRSIFELESVIIDYIKSPQCIRLTQEQLDSDLDISQVMEYPDYVCQEIINELVTIVMENAGDARLQNHLAVSQSIASPTQQQSQPQQNS